MFLYNYNGDCMYSYIEGRVTEIESNYITLDNNGIGYQIFTANPYTFNVNEDYRVYVYQYVREDEISLYGFKEKKEKELFLKLIDVKGLGCKMALPILATGSIDGIIDAIERENILYLKKFPKIGDKLARQIVLDLKGKFNGSENNNIDSGNDSELMDALLALGYKQADIRKVIKGVDNNLSIENQIKEALKLLLK